MQKSLALLVGGLLALSGCDSSKEPLRTWEASDHAHPPASQVDPSRVPGSATPVDEATANLEIAKMLWVNECAKCHGMTGHGDGSPLPAGIDFADSKWQETRTDEELAKSIAEGKPPMPAYGPRVNDAQLAVIVKIVRAFGATQESNGTNP